MNRDIIISIDFETYGGIPGLHSAASIGAVAYQNYREIGEFYAVFKELKHAGRDPNTMEEFWAKQPEAWAEIQKNQQDPAVVMENFYQWVTSLPGSPRNRIFAANPNQYDGPFLTFYAYKFLRGKYEDMAYRMRVMDIRSYFAGLFGYDYSTAERYKMPKEWFKGAPEYSHHALDDARQQGIGLMNMIRMAKGDEELELAA